MKWIPKYQKAGKFNIEWIKDKDVNGNIGYRNIKTGQFRATIPNSQEERQQEQRKNNIAVLKQYSADSVKYNRERATRKNHSDESVKKVISKPSLVMRNNGKITIVRSKELAPGEDSAKLNTTIEEQIPMFKGLNLVTGLGKLALSKMGQNEFSHWARNSLLNETSGSLTKNIATPLIESEAVPLEDGFVYRTFTPSHGGFVKNNLVYNRSYGVRGLIKSLRPLLGKVLSVNRAPESYFNFNKNLSQIWKKRRVISKVNKELKKGIKENSILESYNKVPANKDIGTAYDYLDFLDNIYPNSKLNATFYHGGPKGITKFKTAKELGSTNKGINSATKDYGIYLADDKSLAQYYAGTHKKANRHLYNVRVNVQNPMRYETNNWYMDKFNTTGDLRFRPGEITQKWYDKLNLKNYDGIYHTKSKNAFDNGELVMFDGNNIHIMGTPEESQMFRKWKQNPQYSSKPLQEEIPLTPEQYERSFLNYAKAATPGLIFAGLAATPLAIIQYNKYQKSKVANDRARKH